MARKKVLLNISKQNKIYSNEHNKLIQLKITYQFMLPEY